MPGETATLASSTQSLANSSEPRVRYCSGIGAQTNIVPFGFSTVHPILFRPSTSTSRRFLWTSTIWRATDGSLVAQLTVGGRLVQPIGPSGAETVTVFVKRGGQLVEDGVVTAAHFVPLRGRHGVLR